jgi:hypothetical protein
MPEIGQTVSYYRILEKLGQGGMGVAYRAEDAIFGLKEAGGQRFIVMALAEGEMGFHRAGRGR